MDNGFCRKALTLIKKKNISYILFKTETNKIYNINGKGFYNSDQILRLLQDNGFKVVETVNSPGFIGSILFQILLFFRYIFGLKSLTSKFDLLLQPLTLLDRFFTYDVFSIELVLKIRKNN